MRHDGLSVFIGLSLVVAAMLDILPLPPWATYARPQWLWLMLLYWLVFCPHKVGLSVAWLAGLWLDLLQNTLLGQHAFIFALLAYITLKLQRRVVMFPMLQQILVVVLLTMIYQLFMICIQGMVDQLHYRYSYWAAPFFTALLWPWLCALLRGVPQQIRNDIVMISQSTVNRTIR